jgi:hypothetical protein
MKDKWRIAALLLLALIVGYVLGNSSIFPRAYAQSEGATGRVILAVGSPVNTLAPVVLVDTVEQTLMVYEYDYRARTLWLKTARTYRFDKQLAEFAGVGPTVEQVRVLVGGAPR